MISLSAALLGQLTAQLVSMFNGGSIRVFAGPRPDDPSHAETGTLLGVVSVDATAGAGVHFVAGRNGFYNAPYEHLAFRASASGEARWFRLVGPGDTGSHSTSEPRIDGSIGTFEAPGDMAWATTTVTVGSFYTLDSFVYLIHPMGPTP